MSASGRVAALTVSLGIALAACGGGVEPERLPERTAKSTYDLSERTCRSARDRTSLASLAAELDAQRETPRSVAKAYADDFRLFRREAFEGCLAGLERP